MANAGYTDSNDAQFATARAHGIKVISDSLKLCLANDEGVLEGKRTGKSMKLNYHILNYRKGLIPELAVRPSPLGDIQVLVVHGTEDAAVSIDAEVISSLADLSHSAVPVRTPVSREDSYRLWRRQC